jgi:hypothetical protein
LPPAGSQAIRAFRDLVARVMPFDLVIEGELADGRPARVSRGSMCGSHGAVAGTVRYFADSHGVARAAVEGTNIPFELIRRYATLSAPTVEYREDRRHAGLVVARQTEYFGFELERQRSPLPAPFPPELADSARDALTQAVLEGRVSHPDQRRLSQALARLDEYWRRSGGTRAVASQERRRALVREQLENVTSWEDFLRHRLQLDVDSLVAADERAAWDALPVSLPLLGDRVPLVYDVESGVGVVRLRLREGQARRLRSPDIPPMDRPLRFEVARRGAGDLRADSAEELRRLVNALPRQSRPQRRSRR